MLKMSFISMVIGFIFAAHGLQDFRARSVVFGFFPNIAEALHVARLSITTSRVEAEESVKEWLDRGQESAAQLFCVGALMLLLGGIGLLAYLTRALS